MIAVGTLRLFGLIAIASLLLHLEIARLYLAVAFPMGLTALIASRWIWRRVIARERARGEFRTAVLVVGVRGGAVVDLARNLERDDAHGYRVVGVCVPGYGGDVGEVVTVNGRDIPVLGDEHSVTDALEQVGADTVAVTASERFGPEGCASWPGISSAIMWTLLSHRGGFWMCPGRGSRCARSQDFR